MDSRRIVYLAAPALVLVYGLFRIADGIDGERGPGFAWTAGHLAFLAAMVLFVPITLDLRRHWTSAKPLATVFAVITLLGIAAFMTQFTIDIVAGFIAADHAGMAQASRDVRNAMFLGNARPFIYDFGPILFSAGLLALVIPRKPWYVPVLVLINTLLPIVDKDLIPVAAVILLVAFLILTRAPRGQASTR